MLPSQAAHIRDHNTYMEDKRPSALLRPPLKGSPPVPCTVSLRSHDESITQRMLIHTYFCKYCGCSAMIHCCFPLWPCWPLFNMRSAWVLISQEMHRDIWEVWRRSSICCYILHSHGESGGSGTRFWHSGFCLSFQVVLTSQAQASFGWVPVNGP